MSDNNNPFSLRYIINPLYWPTWLGLGFLWLTTRLPYRMILALGSVVGFISLLLLSDRRRTARINIRLCFPELSDKQQRRLLRKSFYNTGMALFESALAWWGSEAKLKPLLHIEGLENLQSAEEKGCGIIMLGAHYTTLEMGGRIMSTYVNNFTPTYKSARNKVFERVMAWSRKQIHNDLIRSMHMRDVVRALKNRKIIWYAPDQDFGVKSGVFAPFMGVQAATLTMASRLSKSTGAPVLPWYAERLPESQGYKLTIAPALDSFPSGDDLADTTRVNQAIEKHIRHVPEQYLWGHRRFKTRPQGEPYLYKPKRDTAMKKYSLLLFFLAIPAVLYAIAVAIKFKNIHFFTGRLGLARYANNVDLWLHAASVGEINAVVPLILLFQEKHPDWRILLTTNTPTGYQNGLKKLPGIQVQFLPFDWYWAGQRFLQSVKPKRALIFETELWPNLYEYAFWKNIRLIIINGRLSARSTSAGHWRSVLYSRCIQSTYMILTRSETDKQRYMRFYQSEEKFKVLGNIKWAGKNDRDIEPVSFARPYLLLASTRDGEEKLLIDTLHTMIKTGAHMVVIIPRHPKRLNVILKDLSGSDFNISVRSRNDPVTADTQIYIADTFGEMSSFISGAELVVMGGSFLPFGGQNIIEVARQGKAVIFGPHMDNFEDEARTFIENDAGIQVKIEQLSETVNSLLADAQQREKLGQQGIALVEKNHDIVKIYYDEIMKLYDRYTH